MLSGLSMRLGSGIHRVGTVALVAITVGTLAVVAMSAVLRSAADDLYAAVEQARGVTSEHTRTAYGMWLSAHLEGNLPQADLDALHARADDLAHRSDRLREAAAVPALIGLLVALITGAPEGVGDGLRDSSQPVTKTISNGTA
jgi:hypothetical protein